MADGSETSAISIEEAAEAFAGLARFDRLVLAVSGGPDSLALLLLAARAKRESANPFPEIAVATVDHGLRPQSAEEAHFVAFVARDLGLRHETLVWQGDKPTTGIANAARDARYRLLADFARTFDGQSVAVVTAHHRDDQAETFAMHLARGSGIEGLGAMRAERSLTPGSGVVLARPLLEFGKQRLIATVAAFGLSAVEDPTNHDRCHERARVRHALRELGEAGISAKALATSARRLSDARDALIYAERHFVETLRLDYGNEVFARFDRKAFAAAPAFLRQRVLSRLIARYGGASPPPSLAEVEDLVAAVAENESVTATLGGTVVSAGDSSIKVWRELGRLLVSDVDLAPGETRAWDGRFKVGCGAECEGRRISVRPLGQSGFQQVAPLLLTRGTPPASAAYALPAFWDGDHLLAVPSLGPYAGPGFARWAHQDYRVCSLFSADY